MSPTIAGLLGFGAVVALIIIRVPVAIAMGIVGACGLGVLNGWESLAFILGRAAFDAVSPASLSVVPLFVMMGVFAAHGGLSRSLYAASTAFLGHWRGGLAVATVGASAVFGAICGSSLATAATMGRVAMPEMRRQGYADSLSAASIVAGGTLGVLIPPSILLMLYGLLTEQSIGQLFAAGVLPGVLGMGLYMLAVVFTTARRPELGMAMERTPWIARLRVLVDVWQVILLFLVVLGGMYLGYFTPSEAAAVGAAGALFMAAINRKLNWKTLRSGLLETTTTTAMIFMILIGAAVFNYFIDATGIADMIVKQVAGFGLNRYWVLFLIVVMYLILGCLMDSMSMILLTIAPVFPLITSLGFDPIWFGVLLVTLAEIGMITPPVGMNLFVLQAIVPDLKMPALLRGIIPFVFADIVRLGLLVAIPAISLWLPSHMMK
ncbi:TRAP transporter large permease [Achromobacter denitrificans]|uniref:TRAP transporter large permease protein n=1 Tax=Achromobacter denitrificans TaxID=32002 RepID=A0ABZ3GDN2_ACHDE|nr:TRAP transporter large permease [Achromobacter denitrificans]